jgi:predicted RNA-binding protein
VWRRILAIAASMAIIITLGVSLYNRNNVCVSFVSGQKITDKEVVMNDVDNILADLLSDRVDMEEQLESIFGE